MSVEARNNCQRKAHYTLIWIIENSSAHISGNAASPRFTAQSIGRTNWGIIFGNGFFLIQRLEDNGPCNLDVKIELSISAGDELPFWQETCKKQFTCPETCCPGPTTNQCECFGLGHYLFEYGTLIVRCRMWRTGVEISKSEIHFAHTRFSLDSFNFIWTIPKFSSLQTGHERKYILNPPSHGFPQLILRLFLDINQKVIIKLLSNTATRDRNFIYKFSLLDCDGRTSHIKEREWSIQKGSKINLFITFAQKCKLVDNASNLTPNDTLTLKCEFIIEVDPVYISNDGEGVSDCSHLESSTKNILQGPDDACTAACPFKKAFVALHENNSLSDISLRVGEKSFPAHKNILGARSPVFEAMFTHDMKEKTSKTVDISDLSANTVDRLLLYIYKNTIEELQWERAIDLFTAADKYQLIDLRKKCTSFLKSNLSVASVCSTLSLAVMHEDDDLQTAAEDFISERDNEVLDSNEWKNFAEENSQLALEITARVIQLIKKKIRKL